MAIRQRLTGNESLRNDTDERNTEDGVSKDCSFTNQKALVWQYAQEDKQGYAAQGNATKDCQRRTELSQGVKHNGM